MNQGEREEYVKAELRHAIKSRNIVKLNAAMKSAKKLAAHGTQTYITKDCEDFFEAENLKTEVGEAAGG